MTCNITSFSTLHVFQSYLDNGWVIMKARNPIYDKKKASSGSPVRDSLISGPALNLNEIWGCGGVWWVGVGWGLGSQLRNKKVHVLWAFVNRKNYL